MLLKNTFDRLLARTEHRPWPLPEGPWVMSQRWLDLLFAHWPVPVNALRDQIPADLAIDTFDGQAWLGVVPFRMEAVRPRGIPSVPGISDFPELNLRTYVRHNDKPGVWFFSLDAGHPLAVRVARSLFHLPYFDARMRCAPAGRYIRYRSQRTHKNAHPAHLQALYAPSGGRFSAAPGSLEHWLTERYCLYTANGRGQLYRGEIHHAPWPLQPAEAEFQLNTLASPLGLKLSDPPATLHFARSLDVVVWPLRACL